MADLIDEIDYEWIGSDLEGYRDKVPVRIRSGVSPAIRRKGRRLERIEPWVMTPLTAVIYFQSPRFGEHDATVGSQWNNLKGTNMPAPALLSLEIAQDSEYVDRDDRFKILPERFRLYTDVTTDMVLILTFGPSPINVA